MEGFANLPAALKMALLSILNGNADATDKVEELTTANQDVDDQVAGFFLRFPDFESATPTDGDTSAQMATDISQKKGFNVSYNALKLCLILFAKHHG